MEERAVEPTGDELPLASIDASGSMGSMRDQALAALRRHGLAR
jgi:hypothetical protein